MSDRAFFEQQREQSRVKSEIVAKYFRAWCTVMQSRAPKVAYLDLFAGPGRYEDGASSTPVEVLTMAVNDDVLRQKLVALFNDVDEENVRSLQSAIEQIEGIETLTYAPSVIQRSVGDDIVREIRAFDGVPTLFFVDPFGYKGLSLQLINTVLRGWGCDGIFFFNYNRVRAGLNNDLVRQHMDALFGHDRVERLRRKMEGLSPRACESAVVNELSEALRDLGGKYVLPFQFLNDLGTRTSHYLVFVSKHQLGYEIMKDVMAKASSEVIQGVASLRYCESDEGNPLLAGLLRPLDALGADLCNTFEGRTLTVNEIFERHNVGTPFVRKNYKAALLALERAGAITCQPPAAKRRRKGTMGDEVRVTFARRTVEGS